MASHGVVVGVTGAEFFFLGGGCGHDLLTKPTCIEAPVSQWSMTNVFNAAARKRPFCFQNTFNSVGSVFFVVVLLPPFLGLGQTAMEEPSSRAQPNKYGRSIMQKNN